MSIPKLVITCLFVTLLAGHRIELDLHRATAGDLRQRSLRVRLYLIAQRAARCGENDGRPDAPIVEHDVTDHAEIDDVALEFGVLNA